MQFPSLSKGDTTTSVCAPLGAIASIVREGWSGTLRCQTDKIIRQLHWYKGSLLSAQSNAKSDLPGTFLHKNGQMTKAEFDLYLVETKKSKGDPWDTAVRLAPKAEARREELRQSWLLQLSTTVSGLPDTTNVTLQPSLADTPTTAMIHGVKILAKAAQAMSEAEILTLCPLLIETASVRIDPKQDKIFGDLPLEAEEKGLLTVARHSATVKDIYSGSFIGREKITPLICGFWLSGLLILESAEEIARQKYESSLSPPEKELRAEMRALAERIPTMTYYDWLGVTTHAAPEEILAAAERRTERFASPMVEKIFLADERALPEALLKLVENARSILSDSKKRSEYDRFLSEGKGGSFLDQSVSHREEEFLKESNLLLKKGKGVEAIALLEKALAEVPASAELIAKFARALRSTGGSQDPSKRDRALKELKRGMQLSPPSSVVFEVLGEWMEDLKQIDKAKEAYRRALSMSPFSTASAEGLERLEKGSSAKTQIAAIHKKIGELSHYDLLNVSSSANLRAIQDAYRECTKKFHPDRFFQSQDAELRDHAKDIYKRMVDAYMTLKNASKRSEYDARLKSKSRPLNSPQA